MYDLKNEITISEGLDRAVAEGMRQVRSIHRRHVVKKTAGTVAGAAFFCMAFLVWGYHNPVLASQIPVIGRLFATVQEEVTYSGDYSGKIQVFGAGEETEKDKYVYSASEQGYTFTASELYCDGYSLYLGLTVKKEGGFGKISTMPVTDDGEERVQVIALYGISLQPEGEERVSFSGIPLLEGVQTSEDTFEGIIKLSLEEVGAALPNAYDMYIYLDWFMYIDESKREESEENIAAHVLRDENGNEIYDEEGMPVMDDSYEEIPCRYNETGSWKLCVPIVVDASEIQEYEIHETSDGIGIDSVTVTPYEVRVQSILPPLYPTEETQMEAKKEYIADIAEGMTDEQIEEQVHLALYGDYGVAVFDEAGQRLLLDTAQQNEKGFAYTYPVQGRALKELHIYVGEGEMDCFKETEEQAMAARALYYVNIKVE